MGFKETGLIKWMEEGNNTGRMRNITKENNKEAIVKEGRITRA